MEFEDRFSWSLQRLFHQILVGVKGLRSRSGTLRALRVLPGKSLCFPSRRALSFANGVDATSPQGCKSLTAVGRTR